MLRPRPGVMGQMERRRRQAPPENDTSFRGVLDRLQGKDKARVREDDICAALARIAETPDGEMLLQWIHNQTFGHVPAADAPEGALRESAALNRFATKFFNLLDRGLARDSKP